MVSKPNADNDESNAAKVLKEPVIGIDLGTSTSCVAYLPPGLNSQVKVLPCPTGGNHMRSWVGISQTDDVGVGEGTEHLATWIYDAKFMLGKQFNDKKLASRKNEWPFKVVQGSQG